MLSLNTRIKQDAALWGSLEVGGPYELQRVLEAVIQSTQDAISVVDRDGIGILINPAYTRLTGLEPEDVIGKPADVDIAEGESMHMQVLRTGKPVHGVPMKVGPHKREVIVNVAPVYVGDELWGSVGVIHDVSEIRRLTQELEKANRLLRSMRAKYTFQDIIARQSPLRVAVEQARRAAQAPVPILLRGESGTGKELFAHAIHHASSRREQAFVRVDCSILNERQLEAELFGVEGDKMRSTIPSRPGLLEEASGGTVFLDEIGEMPLSVQSKLVHVLQSGEVLRVGGHKAIPVDVRLISATRINLEQAVAQGRFREDLYYRLNVLPIVLPPLRYCKEDLPELTMHIIQKHNQIYGRKVESISKPALHSLQAYDWPGNVRELENAIGRAMLNMGFQETVMGAQHLPRLSVPESSEFASRPPLWTGGGCTLGELVRQFERQVIEDVLRQTGGNKTEAAKLLGISLRSLYYKIGVESS